MLTAGKILKKKHFGEACFMLSLQSLYNEIKCGFHYSKAID
jgi:hypothetical protein